MALSEQELAIQTGSAVETVREIIQLGFIGREEIRDGFPPSLIPRVRMAMHLQDSGIALDDLAPAVADGSISLQWADALFGRPVPMLPSTAREVVDELDVSHSFSTQIRISLGITDDDALVREDEVRLLELLSGLVAFGVDEDVVSRFIQTAVDDMRRVAQAGRELWVDGFERPLLAAGLSHAELLEAEAEPAAESFLLGEEVTQILWNRFIEEESFQAAVQHLEEALEEAGIPRSRERRPAAVAFLDLSGYTNMTERKGDEVAAERARRMVELIRPHIARHSGRMVKRLGDGAMLHFPDPVDAVLCGLALVSAISDDGLPPARVGINAGPLILRDADFFGRTVNIAARLVDYARPHEVLTTGEVSAISTEADIVYDEIGPVTVKGVADPVDVYLARR